MVVHTERPYAAEIDMSAVDPKYYKQVSRGFGNEFWVDPRGVSQAKVLKIYSKKNAKQSDKRYYANMPRNDQELHHIWKSAHNKKKHNDILTDNTDQLSLF